MLLKIDETRGGDLDCRSRQTLIDKNNLSGLSVVQQNPVVKVSVRNVLEKGENIARLVALQAFLLKLGDHFKRTQPQTITAVGGHGIIYIRNGYDRSVVGISPKCVSRMISTVTTYTSAINGTTTCATEEIRLIPPIITSATHTVSISPDITTLHE